MSPATTFVVPGDINTRTGGYRYDKRIIDGMQAIGNPVELVSLDGDFPFPSGSQQEAASAQFDRIADGSKTIVDGLAFSAIPEIIARHSDRLDFIALVHHPLALETGLTAEDSALLKQRETDALRLARIVVTTSTFTASALTEFQVSADRIRAVLPGTDAASLTPFSNTPPWNLLCVATITARKGHEVLIKALAELLHHNWHLTCAGNLEREPETYQRLLTSIDALNLGPRVSFAGEVDDQQLSLLYQQTDLAVLASWYEGYGMVLDEAIARALPIVCTRGGAIQQTVPEGAGILVEPGDHEALAQALDSFFTDDRQRQSLRDNAMAARMQQRSWQQAVMEFCSVLAL